METTETEPVPVSNTRDKAQRPVRSSAPKARLFAVAMPPSAVEQAIRTLPEPTDLTYIQNKLPEDGLWARRKLERIRRNWEEDNLENLKTILLEYLRYAFINDVDLVTIGGVAPFEVVDEIHKFTARMTVVMNVVTDPLATWENFEDLRTQKASNRATLILSPYRNTIHDVSSTIILNEFRTTLGRRGRDNVEPFTLNVCDESVSLISSREQAKYTITFVRPGDPFSLYEFDSGGNILARTQVFPFFGSLDHEAASLDAAMKDLSASKEPELNFEDIREELSTSRLSKHEQSALETIGKQLREVEDGIPRWNWDSLFLPSSIRPPNAINYHFVEGVLQVLQRLMRVAETSRLVDLTERIGTLWESTLLALSKFDDVPGDVKGLYSQTVSEDNAHQRHVLFYGRLVSQSDDEMPRAFSRLARLMSVLNRLPKVRVRLDLSIATVESRHGDLMIVVTVVCSVANVNSVTANELRGTIGRLVHSAFVGVYGLRFQLDADPLEVSAASNLMHETALRLPIDGDGFVRLRGFPDWSHLVDFMTALDKPSALKMSLAAGGSTPDDVDQPSEPAPDLIEDAVRSAGVNGEYVTVRVVVAADGPGNPTLVQMVNAELGIRPTDILEGIDDEREYRCSVSNALRFFHPPFGEWFGARRRVPLSLPSPLRQYPTGGLYLGGARVLRSKGDVTIPVHIPDVDRLRHLYVIGKTGSGKTNFLRGMVAQDLRSPSVGLAVVDPHGDLAEHLVNLLPKGRREDLQLVDLSDPDLTPVFNPLIGVGSGTIDRSRTSQQIVELLKARTYHEHSGPRFDELLRLALDTLLDNDYPHTPSLTDASLLLQDDAFQKHVRDSLSGRELRRRWEIHDRLRKESEYYNLLDWVTSKIDDLTYDPILRTFVGGSDNTVDIESVVSDNGILVVSIPESNVGPNVARFIGSLILLQLKNALLARRKSSRSPFFVYVDEFQKFAQIGFEDILAEGRKFGVGLIMAHQNMEQLRQFDPRTGNVSRALLDSILGNVGSIVSFGIGATDASVLSPQLGVGEEDIMRIGRFEAVARLTVDSVLLEPFTLAVPFAPQGLDPRNADGIREYLTRHALMTQRDVVERQIRARRERHSDNDNDPIGSEPVDSEKPSRTSFLDEWLERRKGVSDPTVVSPRTHGSLASEDDSKTVKDAKSLASWGKLVGPVVLLEKVASYLKVSIDEMWGLKDRSKVLILETSSGSYVVPRAYLKRGAILDGLSELLTIVNRAPFSDWARAGWLATPNVVLDSMSPVEYLGKNGFDELLSSVASYYSEES